MPISHATWTKEALQATEALRQAELHAHRMRSLRQGAHGVWIIIIVEKDQRPGRRLSKLTHGAVECGSVVPIPSQRQRLHVGPVRIRSPIGRTPVDRAIAHMRACWMIQSSRSVTLSIWSPLQLPCFFRGVFSSAAHEAGRATDPRHRKGGVAQRHRGRQQLACAEDSCCQRHCRRWRGPPSPTVVVAGLNYDCR